METENLKALVQGRELNGEQKVSAFDEYHKLLKSREEAIRLLRDLAELQNNAGYKIGLSEWREVIYKFLEKQDK